MKTKLVIATDKLSSDLFTAGWGTQEIKVIIKVLKASKQVQAMTKHEIAGRRQNHESIEEL